MGVAGRGASGVVYHATDTESGEPVAVKLLGAADGSERFEREVQVLAG
jgi:serine/threonine protein kinase